MVVDLISSKLLLYRLVSVFELAQEEDGIGRIVQGYKPCLGVELWYVEDNSKLLMYDYKGAPNIRSEGSLEASKDAAALLAWLVLNNIPLAYDGTIAGTVVSVIMQVMRI